MCGAFFSMIFLRGVFFNFLACSRAARFFCDFLAGKATLHSMRLEEMVMGPDYESPRSTDERGRSQTTERYFNANASRSRDDGDGS